jgi:hypothetical protein
VEFEKVAFAFGLDPPVLELRNPPRSLGTFFNSVAQTLVFKVAIQPIEVDVSKWVKAFAPSVDAFSVTGASIADITLSNGISARVVVAGTSDVRATMKRFVGQYPNVIVRLQLSGLFRSLPFKCDLYNDAKVNILDGVEEELTSILRKSLFSALL